MSNNNNIYVCTNCDAQFPKWNGRCLECGQWGSLIVASKQIISQKKEVDSLSIASQTIDLREIKGGENQRIVTQIKEVDRVLGGGLVPGSLVLLSGEPGAGKSTLVAQIADRIVKKEDKSKIIYISGEESALQVKTRLERLNCDLSKLQFLGETNVEKIVATIKANQPDLVIVDSIQTMYSSEVSSESGGISQIRASTVKFLETAKNKNVAIILIGHITKDGQVAGPKSLEHIVDTVLSLDVNTTNNYSVLRASKNRFGSINEIGIFEMSSSGFQEISNPASIFIDSNQGQISGSVVSCILEGTRPFLVDIQALVTKTVFGYPQRKASGIDINRLQILTAVLNKRTKLNLANQDVVVNVVGGLRVSDPALDLAICTAIITSLLNQVIDRKTLILGEVGLGGEIRNIVKPEFRIKEAEKLGFEKIILPNDKLKITSRKAKIEKINQVSDILNLF